jgi:hypothetical protein
LQDCESDECVVVSAYAREAESKPKMDNSQVTGSCSSYARKYALNGMFLLDDTKDADTDEFAQQNKDEGKTTKPTGKNGAKTSDDKKNQKMIESVDKVLLPTADGKVTGEQIDRLKAEIKRVGTTEKDFCTLFKVANIFELTQAQIIAAIGALMQKKDGEGLKKK